MKKIKQGNTPIYLMHNKKYVNAKDYLMGGVLVWKKERLKKKRK